MSASAEAEDAGGELGPWVTVHEGYDPVAAQFIHELLVSEGFATLRVGMQNPALMGVGNFAARQLVRVRQQQAEAARELVVALGQQLDAPAADGTEATLVQADEAAQGGGEALVARPPRGRIGRLAWGLFFVLFALLLGVVAARLFP